MAQSDMSPGVNGVYKMVKTVYVCDVNTCETEQTDPTKIFITRLMDKEYHFCGVCFKSLQKFISDRMNEGQEPEKSTSDMAELLKTLKQQPQVVCNIPAPQPQPWNPLQPTINPNTWGGRGHFTSPFTWSEPNTGWNGQEFTVPSGPTYYTTSNISLANAVIDQYQLK